MDEEKRQVQQEELTAVPEPEEKGESGGESTAGKQPKTAGTGKSKRLPVRNLPRLLILLAVVLVIVVLTTMEDGNHFASLRRWLMYGDSGTGQNYYTYVADGNNRYAMLGEESSAGQSKCHSAPSG